MSEEHLSRLYPRLLHSSAAELAESHGTLTPTELRKESDVRHPRTVFTPTGGNRIGEQTLRNLQKGVRTIAEEGGYPSSFPDRPARSARREFDFKVARYLHENMGIVPGEAGKDDVWEFLTCVLLPDVVRWRFPGGGGSRKTGAERYLGGVRNTFQRLWWRAEVLGEDGDYELVQRLNEDELVQVMERPQIASQRRLARAVAKWFLEMVDRFSAIDRMDVMRDAQKRLRRLTPLISFSALEEDQVTAHVKQVLARAAEAISGVRVEEWAGPEDMGESAGSLPERVELLARQAGVDLDAVDYLILDVLLSAFPGRLDARNIADRINSRQEGGGRVSKSDVNSKLYRKLETVLERTDETPPQWRLLPSVVPDNAPGKDTAESSSAAEASSDFRAEGWVGSDEVDKHAAHTADVVEMIARQARDELEPLDYAILHVLIEVFPEWIEARQIRAKVGSVFDGTGPVTRSDVNKSLYRERGQLFERTDESPSRWRLLPSAVPESQPIKYSGQSIEAVEELRSEGSRELEADVTVTGDESAETTDDEIVFRVKLADRTGERQAVVDTDPAGLSDESSRLRVVSRLLELQTPYFVNGPRGLRPLTGEELAEDLGVHPSTVSRATDEVVLVFNGKRMRAKDLFSPGIPTTAGDEISAVAVKDIIMELITMEEKRSNPFSDAEIADRLNERGIETSRRTVAKYRQALGIPGQQERSASA